jgi:AcrR family transcriptional regulator
VAARTSRTRGARGARRPGEGVRDRRLPASSASTSSASASRSAERDLPREQLSGIQRSRLIAAAVRAVEELGYADATVAQITSRARVSRRTFYELFANREACLAEVLEDAVALIACELAAADLEDLPWQERIRLGLWTILSFFDREPILARVCVVQALQGGPPVLARREQILTRLAAIVDEGRPRSARAKDLTPLTAEGLVGAAHGILYARVLRGQQEPLRGLLGELMGMVVLPYQGPAAARREQTRSTPEPLRGVKRQPLRAPHGDGDPLNGVAMRLTYRTARVLECVAEHPGTSNREVAEHAGITDQGQVSKLLARLKRLELLVNDGAGHLKGEPNAWNLTARGQLVVEGIRTHLPQGVQAA